MALQIPDEVRKQVEIGAPRERVWHALTDPAELLGWFPTRGAELDLRPGGRISLRWEHDADEGVVVEVEPPTRFVFDWRPEGSGRPYTRVTITLEETQGRTRLVLVETGFSALTGEIRQGNDEGWAEELEELRAYVVAG
ncbi:MAG: SRPBCC family protein [Actinomycetota bacterium]